MMIIIVAPHACQSCMMQEPRDKLQGLSAPLRPRLEYLIGRQRASITRESADCLAFRHILLLLQGAGNLRRTAFVQL